MGKLFEKAEKLSQNPSMGAVLGIIVELAKAVELLRPAEIDEERCNPKRKGRPKKKDINV